MKRFMAVAALSCVTALTTACSPEAARPAGEVPATAEATAPETTARATTTGSVASAPEVTGIGATPDAPAFANLPAGAELDAPALTAAGPAGPGGMATYTTSEKPDDVIVFHKTHAEAAGLSSSMAMNQGEARAYGATNPTTGANLQVVASALETGATSVHISWSAGR